jgi:hypothetical protein
VTQRIKPPLNGPYNRRAEVLVSAIAPRIEKEFGRTQGKYITRDAGDKVHYTWALPCRVTLILAKGAGSADPAIWINRQDPENIPSPHGDWKNQEIRRDSKSASYDIDEIVTKTLEAVAYNRGRMEEKDSNDKALAAELDGTTVPSGAVVQRNSENGLYTIAYTARRDEISLAEAKAFLQQISPLAPQPTPAAAEPVVPG